MAPAVSCLASIGGPGYPSIFLVDLFVPKIKLRERERERVSVQGIEVWDSNWERIAAWTTVTNLKSNMFL